MACKLAVTWHIMCRQVQALALVIFSQSNPYNKTKLYLRGCSKINFYVILCIHPLVHCTLSTSDTVTLLPSKDKYVLWLANVTT